MTIKQFANRVVDTVVILVIAAVLVVLVANVWKFSRNSRPKPVVITCPFCGKEIPINVGKEDGR